MNTPYSKGSIKGNIRPIDMILIDEIFGMESGYVLNFSDRTFTAFFAHELDIDIDDPLFSREGTSKAKRLRCLLQTVDKPTAVKVLKSLWEYREAFRLKNEKEEKVENANGRLLAVINRLDGIPDAQNERAVTPPALDRNKFARLKAEMVAIWKLPPQPRGYAFEKFLSELFDTYGLESRAPFRLYGEQIDGSFQFANQTYLVEAKWEQQATGVDHLHTFHGKIDQKAAWARGLFVTFGGFTKEGLAAFGRGKKVICMDGKDLFDMLNREIPLNHVLEKKARAAVETGLPFVAVSDLFPIHS